MGLSVSVPSTGRSGLQLGSEALWYDETFSFSTLYGSKWVATEKAFPHLLMPRPGFQYPLRVEVGCNALMTCTAALTLAFQYPLRVEVGCNVETTSVDRWTVGFQYPLRVEVGCNSVNASRAIARIRVSVPSTGRSGLQRDIICQ